MNDGSEVVVKVFCWPERQEECKKGWCFEEGKEFVGGWALVWVKPPTGYLTNKVGAAGDG